MKLKFSNSHELKQKYDGKTTPMRLTDQEQFGMLKKDSWYGGNHKRTGLVTDTSIVLLMDGNLKTLDVAYIIGREDEIPAEDLKAFGFAVEEELPFSDLEDERPVAVEPSKPRPVSRRNKRK